MKKNIFYICKWISLVVLVFTVLLGIRNILWDIPSLLPVFIFYGFISLILYSLYRWKKETIQSFIESVRPIKLHYFIYLLCVLAVCMLFYDILMIAARYTLDSLIVLSPILPYLYFSHKYQNY